MNKQLNRLWLLFSLPLLLSLSAVTDISAETNNANYAEVVAQNGDMITVSGTVLDGSNAPIIGASVFIQGTTTGTLTDLDGKFSLKVPKGTQISVSCIGYNSKTFLAEKSVHDVKLAEESMALSEVVVTAMGIERKVETLTYATQTVGGNELTRVKESNLINSLQGKTAGLIITPNAGGAGSASKILLRGNSSFFGNNSPLIVIDGTPMSNSVSGQTDRGQLAYLQTVTINEGDDALSRLNPDDIASITVLKGGNAAALYGSAAANGVLMITTKKGQKGQMRVDISSSTQIETPLVLPKLQNTYGTNVLDVTKDLDNTSWGMRLSDMTSSQIGAWRNENGNINALTNNPYNVGDFFKVGANFNNSVAISGGTDRVQSYFSYGNTTALGIIPENKYVRHNISFRENFSLFDDKFNINFSGSYINTRTDNHPGSGLGNILYDVYTAPRNLDMDYYRNNVAEQSRWQFGDGTNGGFSDDTKVVDGDNYISWRDYAAKYPEQAYKQMWAYTTGMRQVWFHGINNDGTGHSYTNNPWFLTRYSQGFNKTQRIFGNVGLSYKIIDGLDVQVRLKYERTVSEGQGERHASINADLRNDNNRRGTYSHSNGYSQNIYGDFITSYNKEIKRFTLSLTAGGSFTDAKSNSWGVNGGATNSGEMINNTAFRLIDGYSSNYFEHSSIFFGGSSGGKEGHNWERAFFATGQLTYKNFATLEGSYREDWYRAFTQFPGLKSHYGYWSAGGSSVMSNYIAMPRQINDFKIRASYSVVGNSIPNSLLQSSATRNAQGQIVINNLIVVDPKPETTGSFEVGFDLSMFKRAFNIDVTYYNSVMKDQMVQQGVYMRNAGKVRNQGVEVTASYIFEPNHNFSWRTGVNFSFNDNKILGTAVNSNGVDSELRQPLGPNAEMRYVVGGSYGDIYVKDLRRNADGSVRISAVGGVDVDNKYVLLGNMNAKFNLGWSNTFSYKDLQIYFLIDGKIGGKVISLTQAFMDYAGTSERTGKAREEAAASGLVFTDNNGNKSPGMIVDGQLVSVQHYYTSISGNGSNPYMGDYIYNATNFRLRELSVGYTFRNLMGNAKDLTLSLVGRNLFFIYKDAPIDPDTSTSTQNGLGGIDIFTMPTTRSYGISIKANF